ncbi:MAG TPA: Rieske 2Fe-2S domain-containing protein, partial [Thermoleophilaceae bacterium]|nr:Rieske 2Fe-2S domain-containing protein [Thermoleophilaceae bacterium]
MRSRSPRGELLVAAALVASGVCAAAFVLLYAFESENTQLLGLSIGLSLSFAALAAVVAGKRVVDQSEAVEERPKLVDDELGREVAGQMVDGAEGVSRRGLLAGAAGVAGAGLGAAALVPLASLGTDDVSETLKASPWRAGTRLVDENGAPISGDQLEVGSWLTAFAEGSDRRALGSSVAVVQIEEADVRVRRSWAPRGIMAYSNICTHAGSAISLFRYPTYEPTSKTPALVCPCHYSTFDVRNGAAVEFGPAGRPLPQLPLRIDAQG